MIARGQVGDEDVGAPHEGREADRPEGLVDPAVEGDVAVLGAKEILPLGPVVTGIPRADDAHLSLIHI